MVDITGKTPTKRLAQAQAKVYLPPEVLDCLDEKKEINSKKGPVFQTAIIAGTMAVKKTSEIIPFCHPIAIESCEFDIQIQEEYAFIYCSVKTSYKTGVEMEALTGVTAAALCTYDMCKAISHFIKIEEVKLLYKEGGKSDITLI